MPPGHFCRLPGRKTQQLDIGAKGFEIPPDTISEAQPIPFAPNVGFCAYRLIRPPCPRCRFLFTIIAWMDVQNNHFRRFQSPRFTPTAGPGVSVRLSTPVSDPGSGWGLWRVLKECPTYRTNITFLRSIAASDSRRTVYTPEAITCPKSLQPSQCSVWEPTSSTPSSRTRTRRPARS